MLASNSSNVFSKTISIEKFSLRKDSEAEPLEILLLSEDGTIKFIVEIFTNGTRESQGEGMAIYFWLGDSTKEGVVGKCTAAIVDSKGKRRNQMESRNKYTFFPGVHGHGWNSFISLIYVFDPANHLLVDDTMTLYLQVEYFPDEPILVPERFSTYTYFKWEIDQFADWLANPTTAPQSLTSRAFSLKNNKSAIFNLELFPNGKKEENAGYLSLFVRSQSTNEMSHKLKYTFALFDGNGKKKKLCRLDQFSLFRPNKGLGLFRYISHEEIKKSGVLVNGTLTISCELQEEIDEKAVVNHFDFKQATIQSPLALGTSGKNIQIRQNVISSSSIAALFVLLVAIFLILAFYQ